LVITSPSAETNEPDPPLLNRTAAALVLFAEAGADVTLLEVGLGGRYDATNVVGAPEVCVITSISLDHEKFLGSTLEGMVEETLKRAALWDEVKDHLRRSALELSGGQQQRLCLARMLAVEPEILLMDEPCSALDPISTGKIEDLISELSKDYTVLIVTHNLQQAHRVSSQLAFFMLGELVEMGETEAVFESAQSEVTRDYLSGRFG